MSDPVRLLSSSRDGVARALLESATAPGPTNDQCDELWSSLAGKLPHAVVAGAAGGAAGAALTKAATSSSVIGAGLLVKGAIVVGFLGSIAAVGLTRPWSSRPEAAPPQNIAPSRVAPPPSPLAPVAVLPPVAGDPIPTPTAPVAASSPAPSVLVAARRAPPLSPPQTVIAAPPAEDETAIALHAESASLLRGRQLLRSGDCDQALAQLKQAATRFPNGALAQEREVLSIEALACVGRASEASTRAEAFVRDYPSSPHATKVRRFTH